jgi:hypothetical protein
MTEPPNGDAGDDGSTALPILAALAVVVLVVIAIVVSTLTRGDGLTEDQRVGRAAVAQNDALQRGSYADFRSHTCATAQGNEADTLARQRDSVAKRGARYVDDVTGVAIDGDRATATVVYHFEKTPDAKISVPATFSREDREWKVCSPGPG